LYWLLFIAPALPLVIFLIPDAMTLMPEPTDPWYTRYTTPIWMLTAFYVYPVTALGMLLGVPPRSPGWVFLVLLYTGFIGWGICSWMARRQAAAVLDRRSHATQTIALVPTIVPRETEHLR
jgi:hypothetical protein